VEEFWNDLVGWWPYLAAAINFGLIAWFVPRVLIHKSEAISAVAWILIIGLVPVLGAVLFILFGNQHVSRPLRKKRRHKQAYHQARPGRRRHHDGPHALAAPEAEKLSPVCRLMAGLAKHFDAQAVTAGNQIDFYHEGRPAFDAMLAAIRQAKHHVHLQKFIFQPDEIGHEFLALLTEKARQGVEVRLLYDAVGSRRLRQRHLTALRAAGGRASVFLPINLLRRSIQVNLRNHRKILVTDGQVGFIGGLNIGDEYLGKVPRFGFWRDTHLRLQGPVVADLQRVFAEDWDFAAGETLITDDDPEKCVYLRTREVGGPYRAQVIDSGPDRDLKGIREIYHAAILRARRRVWIASPYFVPDAGLRDALRLAGYQGLDVRFLGQYRPDKMIPQLAARYYWREVLAAGVKVYQYTRGMMHAKVVIVDDDWASVGTANLDNRSLLLNFEVNCLMYSHQAVAELAAQFERDLETAVRLDGDVYARRPLAARLLENACRLLSPVL
jgi:cardiolipin synthase